MCQPEPKYGSCVNSFSPLVVWKMKPQLRKFFHHIGMKANLGGALQFITDVGVAFLLGLVPP